MSRPSGGKKLIFLSLLIIVILIGLHFSASNLERLTPLESAIRDVFAPIQRFAMIAGRKISQFASSPVRLINVSKRNQLLEERLGELEGKLSDFEEIRKENFRLKKMLDFQTNLTAQMVTKTATVIGRSTDNWFGSITVNKGSQNGIKRDMVVITPAGLVGRIINVSDDTAEVLLITDPRSGVGGLVQETRAPGIIEGVAGGRGLLQMVHIPVDLAPEKDNSIITSGFGSVYPKGIPIGTVLEVRKEQSGLFKMAKIKSYVDFNLLEEVFIITSVNPGTATKTPR